MATVCFRPPPLPPNRKSGRAKTLLSSTYLSFRDPAEEIIDEIEMKPKKCAKNKKKEQTTTVNKKPTLVRCHSEGNLNKAVSTMTINKYIKVLSGSWKNLLSLGGMSRPPKPAATAKKVPPPAVPHEFRHSGSSFGSAGYASSEDAAFLPNNETTNISRDDHSDYGSVVGSTTGKSPGPVFPPPAFTFPGGGPAPPGGLLTHKAAVYYHHQLSLQEDQGIDMTQSPGRDSPGSSSGSGSGSRHSTASLDSGRASYHPLSAAGRSTAGSASSPRCSISSCSIGSDQGRIERMIHQGVPDQEIIHAWLVDLHYEEYFPLFVASGYDLPTIGRMTPEDLTAIGIKKPNHRKRLKAEIAQLNLPDNLPEFVPATLEEWLQLLHLEEYLAAFIDQNYQTVDDVVQLTWEDLEEFGIVKLGHQKKLMLAIKRVKDVRAGKRLIYDTGRSFAQDTVMVHGPATVHTSPSAPPNSNVTFRSFQQPWDQEHHHRISYNSATHYIHHFCTDIVPIKIRTGRGKSLESLEDPCERTHLTFAPDHAAPVPTFYYPPPIGWRTRSYDDGDITPTNEPTILFEGGGTLPRPRGVCRPRPVAKIAAKVRETFPEFDSRYAVTKKTAPDPPRRRDSVEERGTTTVEVHHVRSSPLPLPAYPSSDSLSISLDAHGDLPLPPPPAPATPPHKMNASQSWGAEEQELIKSLALQHRNGSDASFKSSSSTESDSLPFANENAGTIRTRAPNSTPVSRQQSSDTFSPGKTRPSGLPPHPSPATSTPSSSNRSRGSEPPVDVLNDIGNMLANLTDELDAMLEEEKRQQ